MPLLREAKDRIASAYLKSHVENPVDWWTWGPDALARAEELDRPIFLSIGYAACHWCHVMAHESFEDANTARLLNESFVAVKVDREERPDLDAFYMAATQLMTGHGGWPMSVFLLPDGQPFMAGTYYPPEDRGGQVGFPRLLRAMADAWANQHDAVLAQAQELRRSLDREVSFVDHLSPLSGDLDLDKARERLVEELVNHCDAEGGFGGAPKFPRPSYVEALLESSRVEAGECAARTLDAMARNGLYDHLGGGFARYSVDAEWHVPHFEKMLSDQALLARTYFGADRAGGGGTWWSDVARDTLNFVRRELRVPDGFASSLDADAGGKEGSHLTWTVDEVRETLVDVGRADDLEAVLARWRVVTPGAYEGRSIPRLAEGEPFTTPDALRLAYDALRVARARRAQPGRDQKVILEWNAMLVSALFSSHDPSFEANGLELLDSLARTHFESGTWWRTEQRIAPATASDVAWLLDARVDAFEATGDDQWLGAANELSHYLLKHYWDGEVPTVDSPSLGHGFFVQSDHVLDLPARPKEIFDGATPSSHAVACRALARLALCTGDTVTLVIAQRLVELASTLIAEHAMAVPDLVAAAGLALAGVEVVIPGDRGPLSHHVRSLAMPRTVLVTGFGSSPLLEGRLVGRAYVCRGGVCRLPVASVAELDEQLHQALA